MRSLIAVGRGVRVIVHFFTAVLITAGVAGLRAVRLPQPWFAPVVCWWYRRLCRIIRLDIQVRGTRIDSALLIANHVSWLDIPLLGATGPTTFLSKAEVREWPLVGWMADVVGTLYIERGAHQTAGLVSAIADTIRCGRSVVIFPEGTTSDGEDLRRFHPRLFAAAQEPRLGLQPVAIRYGADRAPDPIAPFVGDDSLLAHLWRVLHHPRLHAEVSFLPPIETAGLDRRTLAEGSRAAIAAALGLAAVQPASGAAAAAR